MRLTLLLDFSLVILRATAHVDAATTWESVQASGMAWVDLSSTSESGCAPRVFDGL